MGVWLIRRWLNVLLLYHPQESKLSKIPQLQEKVGGLDQALFISHPRIQRECLVCRRGYELYGVNPCLFVNNMKFLCLKYAQKYRETGLKEIIKTSGSS
jgi:hypothetical protein